jgi:hypothetical protein
MALGRCPSPLALPWLPPPLLLQMDVPVTCLAALSVDLPMIDTVAIEGVKLPVGGVVLGWGLPLAQHSVGRFLAAGLASPVAVGSAYGEWRRTLAS